MEMRDRLIELIDCASRDYENMVEEQHENGFPMFEDFGSWVADDIIADGWIRPPCNVGQTVYYIWFGKIYKGKCHAITIHQNSMQIHLYDCDGDNASISAKSVFPTKEEAENALKERVDNG